MLIQWNSSKVWVCPTLGTKKNLWSCVTSWVSQCQRYGSKNPDMAKILKLILVQFGIWMMVSELLQTLKVLIKKKKEVTARVLAKVKNNYLFGNHLPKILSSEVWDCITYGWYVTMCSLTEWLSRWHSADRAVDDHLHHHHVPTWPPPPSGEHVWSNLNPWSNTHLVSRDITIEDCSLFISVASFYC